MFFDTHCHLYDLQYQEDVKTLIKRAKQNNVGLFVIPGNTLKESLIASKMSKENDAVYAAIGVHPSEISGLKIDNVFQIFAQEIKSNTKIVAIGEIGLDYYWTKDEESKALQRDWFIQQIQFANEAKLPIIVHSRDAYLDTITILKQYQPKYGCVIHCFSYSEEALRSFLDLGFYIGLDGPVTFTNAKTPKRIAEIVPIDRLLLETDSPYLTPVPNRGKRNEPCYIPFIATMIANLKQMPLEDVERITTENGLRFFGIKSL